MYPLVLKYLENTLSIDPQVRIVPMANHPFYRQHTVFEDESEMVSSLISSWPNNTDFNVQEEEAGSPPQTQAPQDSCQIVSSPDSLVVDLLVVSTRALAMMS
jgi:hypothetical protein